MKYHSSKYSKKIAKVLLSAYLLVCVLSIFHFHNFSVFQLPAIDNFPPETSQVQYLANTEFRCLIHQNINLLHSLNLSQVIDSNTCLEVEEKLLPNGEIVVLPITYFSTSNLRAPPTIS